MKGGMICLVEKLYSVETLEKDMQRIISKTTWSKTEEIIGGSLGIELDNGDMEYVNMPKPLQSKILDYIYAHPSSRLSKAYVGGENIRFKNYGYEDKGDCISKPRKVKYEKLDKEIRSVLGDFYVEPQFDYTDTHRFVTYDFNGNNDGFSLLKEHIEQNPKSVICKCNPTEHFDVVWRFRLDL